MKKYFLFALICILAFQITSQSQVQKILEAFPYVASSQSTASLSEMESWGKSQWNSLAKFLDDDSLKLNATYAIDAFVHHASGKPELKAKTAGILASSISSKKTYYGKEFLIQELGILGDDAAVKILSKLLNDPTHGPSAARALATIKSVPALAALKNALNKSDAVNRVHVKAALENAAFVLPELPKSSLPVLKSTATAAQQLLDIQNELKKAKDPVSKRKALHKLEFIQGFHALMIASNYLEDPILQKQAALIMARNAIKDKSLRGTAPREALGKALSLISGVDSAKLVPQLKNYLKALPYDNGWVSLFNGKNLDGWKGLVGNPISRAKMTEQELLMAQSQANASIKNDWVVEDGLLVFTGHGENLCTEKKYGDFEMIVDWKITEKGDAGIYLRGSPQVQIWDTSRREAGAQVGSGGLYNNQKNQSKPLQVADNKIGEWNTFHIIMKGERVTVFLNGVKVTDDVVLENYWDRKIPIFSKEQIELQAHGTYVAYRNIYVKELAPEDLTTPLSIQEKQDGFESLFDGSNLDKWIGNKVGYALEDGVIVTHPELGGGNIYTAEEFGDFEYRFEFQLTPAANNGLGIRTPTKGDAAYVGMELQILDNEADVYKNLKPYQYHGSIYGVIPSKRGYLKPTGQWNEQTVVAKGNKIKVILNGQVILDGDITSSITNGTADGNKHPGLANKTGHIGFLGHGDVVRFRNIRIKKL